MVDGPWAMVAMAWAPLTMEQPSRKLPLMAWFKKTRKPISATPEKASRVPEGLWVKCTGCSQILYNKDLAQNSSVCPKCGFHFRMGSLDRLRALFDGPWVEYDRGLVSTDPLKFTDTKPYHARLKASIAATGMND